jgi:hypothetical protein
MINPHPGLPELEYVKPPVSPKHAGSWQNMKGPPDLIRGEQIVLSACATE